jgi:hypothetical protein
MIATLYMGPISRAIEERWGLPAPYNDNETYEQILFEKCAFRETLGDLE